VAVSLWPLHFFLAAQAKVSLVVTVLPVDANTCRQTLEAEVEVNIPGIGEPCTTDLD
jgi:hypothetical protein